MLSEDLDLKYMPMNIKNLYTCPKCRHPIGWRRRLTASLCRSQWPCKNCGTLLGVGYLGRILISTVWGTSYLWVKPYMDFWVFIVTSLLVSHLILTFDPIVEKQEPHRPDSK